MEIYLFALIFHPICLESNKRVNAKFTLIYHRGKFVYLLQVCFVVKEKYLP